MLPQPGGGGGDSLIRGSEGDADVGGSGGSVEIPRGSENPALREPRDGVPDLGIEKVSVGGNEWKQGERTWKDLQPVSGNSVTVTMKLRS